MRNRFHVCEKHFALCCFPSRSSLAFFWNSVCIGENDIAVGREASFGVKDDWYVRSQSQPSSSTAHTYSLTTPYSSSGQCSDNSDVGTWFSLPAFGKCATADQPFDMNKNCTWRINQRVKTIDSKCLLEVQGTC